MKMRKLGPESLEVSAPPEDLARIDRVLPSGAAGLRYAGPQLQALNR